MDKNKIPKGGQYQTDGSITFPMRGTPPEPIGELKVLFTVDPFDEHRWIQNYCQCKHRELGRVLICPKNGARRVIDFCEYFKLAINPRYCNEDCSVPENERLRE